MHVVNILITVFTGVTSEWFRVNNWEHSDIIDVTALILQKLVAHNDLSFRETKSKINLLISNWEDNQGKQKWCKESKDGGFLRFFSIPGLFSLLSLCSTVISSYKNNPRRWMSQREINKHMSNYIFQQDKWLWNVSVYFLSRYITVQTSTLGYLIMNFPQQKRWCCLDYSGD